MAMEKGKNQLVSVPQGLLTPADMTGKDFKAKVPAEGSGEEGMDKLYKQSPNQMAPGDAESDGMDKPTPTDRSARVSANFKEMKNSNEGGTSLSSSAYVSFGDGCNMSPDQKPRP